MNNQELKRLKRSGIAIPVNYRVLQIGERIEVGDMWYDTWNKQFALRDLTIGEILNAREHELTIRPCDGFEDKNLYPINYYKTLQICE